jgi:hypothetical protein
MGLRSGYLRTLKEQLGETPLLVLGMLLVLIGMALVHHSPNLLRR